MNYSINIDIDGYNKIEIKDASGISDSNVVIVLNNSTNNRLFDYYSSVKDMILNRNRVILLIDSFTSNIDKQISMLMVSYGKYDIYRVDNIANIDSGYINKLLDREPTREEIEQFIGCDVSMYDKINALLAEMCSLCNNTNELAEFIAKNSELLENTVNILDYLKLSFDNSAVAVSKVKEKLGKELDSMTTNYQLTDSKLKEANSNVNKLTLQLDSLKNEASEYRKELEKHNNLGGAPTILSYSTLNTNSLSYNTKAVLYFKEIGKLRYANTFITCLYNLLKIKFKATVKLLIYDSIVGLGNYKPITYTDKRQYNERKGSFTDVNKNEKLVITEPSSDILSDMLNAGIDVIIVYDKMGVTKDLINGAIVYKYNIVGSMNDYRTLKNIESNISDDYIIGPPYISNGIIGIPELNPGIMDKVRNSPTYKSGNKNDTNPTLIASYAQLKNPCRNGEGIVDSIFSRINASSILGNDRR